MPQSLAIRRPPNPVQRPTSARPPVMGGGLTSCLTPAEADWHAIELGTCSRGLQLRVVKSRLPLRPREEIPSADSDIPESEALAWLTYFDALDTVYIDVASRLAESFKAQACAVAERIGSTDEALRTALYCARTERRRVRELRAALRRDDTLTAQWQAREAVAQRRQEQWGHGRQATIPSQGGHWRAALGSSPIEASYPPCSPAQSGGAVSRPMVGESIEGIARAGLFSNPNAAPLAREYALVAASKGRYSPNTRRAMPMIRRGEALGAAPRPIRPTEAGKVNPRKVKAPCAEVVTLRKGASRLPRE
jgi:hypothetical protein